MQAIVQFQTKTKQLVNPATAYKAKVRFELTHWHKTSEGYKAEFSYFYIDGDGKKITLSYLAVGRDIDNNTVNYLASQGSSTDTTYTGRENDFLRLGSLGIIGSDGPFGLTAADWIDYVETTD